MLKDNSKKIEVIVNQSECDDRVFCVEGTASLVVNTDPVTGVKTEYFSLDEFSRDCLDLIKFVVKQECYIYSKHPFHDCAGCIVLPLVNPTKLIEVTGYQIFGNIRQYDMEQEPYQIIDSQKVSFSIGKGVVAANINNKRMNHVISTDDLNLFLQIAKASEPIVFHENIDMAYQIANEGIPESIFRIMVGINEPMHNQDLFIKLDASFKVLSRGDINKLLIEKVNYLKQTIEADTFKHGSVKDLTEQHRVYWGDLIPLVQADASITQPYPIHALPPLARGAMYAIAEHVQAPIGMAAQCVIGAMSHIAQGYVNAPHPFDEHGEPCSLYLLTEGQSGSRKSTSRSLADKAIIEHERRLYEQYCQELNQWKANLAGLDKKEKSEFLITNPAPSDPITRFSDITLESLMGLYVDGVIKNASVASDEAGQFFGGYTMKSDTRNQAIGGFAKLFDDGTVDRIRSKSNLNGSGRAYDVRLTFNLQGQHEVLADALKDPVLRGQGFLPRFILTIPDNLAGTRLQDETYQANNANLDHRLIAYWARCTYLLEDCPLPRTAEQPTGGRYVIPMNKEAQCLDRDFYNEVERLQAKGQRYEYLQAFASRASQLARRMATVFAFFEGLTEIDRKTLSGVCEVIRHSLGEWQRYAEIERAKESEAEKLFKNILAKCIKAKTSRILKTLALKGAPSKLRKVNQFDSCLNELIDFNYVRLVTINRSTYIELNPLLLK